MGVLSRHFHPIRQPDPDQLRTPPGVTGDGRRWEAASCCMHAFGGSVEEFTVPDADHYVVVEEFANPNSAVFRAVATMMQLSRESVAARSPSSRPPSCQ